MVGRRLRLLVIGGVVIMNVMLATRYGADARNRIRKALGAPHNDISCIPG